jgi:ribosome recycling factor
MIDLNLFQEGGQRIVDFVKKEIRGIRTNRANADLVSHILVDAYGVKTPLEQLATINVPEPRLIVIQPWDKNVIKDIEAALSRANLGTMPTVKEAAINVNLPSLNEETRKNLIKILHQKLESGRMNLRNLRDEIRSKIQKASREKTVTEDERYRLFDELDKKNAKFMDEVETIGDRKEKEINTI